MSVWIDSGKNQLLIEDMEDGIIYSVPFEKLIDNLLQTYSEIESCSELRKKIKCDIEMLKKGVHRLESFNNSLKTSESYCEWTNYTGNKIIKNISIKDIKLNCQEYIVDCPHFILYLTGDLLTYAKTHIFNMEFSDMETQAFYGDLAKAVLLNLNLILNKK